MTDPLANGNHLPAIVPCDDPHGGEIVSVLAFAPGDATAYPAWRRGLDGADDQLDQCYGKGDGSGDLPAFVGSASLTVPPAEAEATGVFSAYAVSGIQYAAFVPGPAAWAGGARWFACAAVLNNRLKVPSEYDGSVEGVLAEPSELDEQFAWCKLQQGDDPTDFAAVACNEPHNFEQLATFDAAGPDAAHPGGSALGETAELLCPLLSSSASGGRTDSLPDELGLTSTVPTVQEWADGERAVRCFVVTKEGTTTEGIRAT